MDSRWISRHHEYEINPIKIAEINIEFTLTLFIHRIHLEVRHKAPPEAMIGQGLFSTRWNGLNFFTILFDFCCV